MRSKVLEAPNLKRKDVEVTYLDLLFGLHIFLITTIRVLFSNFAKHIVRVALRRVRMAAFEFVHDGDRGFASFTSSNNQTIIVSYLILVAISSRHEHGQILIFMESKHKGFACAVEPLRVMPSLCRIGAKYLT